MIFRGLTLIILSVYRLRANFQRQQPNFCLISYRVNNGASIEESLGIDKKGVGALVLLVKLSSVVLA